MTIDTFCQTGLTVCLPVSTTPAAAELADSKDGQTYRSYRVRNTGSAEAFIVTGGSDVEAEIPADGVPANGMPIGAGHTETFRADRTHTHLAAITASGTATLYITTGDGI